MKTITDQLFELGKGIIERHPEVRDEGKGYEMADDGGTEIEVGEFLYGLVRILKPNRILETGTYTGISSMYMAQGCKDNNNGHVYTLEIDNYHKTRAERLWQQTQVSPFVTSILEDSATYQPSGIYDLIFLDSEPHLRWNELVRFYPYLSEGGFIGIHDAPLSLCQGNINPDHPEIASWPFGDLPKEFKTLIWEDKLRPFHLPNPRGSVWFYKVRSNEYKWQ